MARCATRVEMDVGEVVLLDSYQTLHGRETFEGRREHGVLWLREAERREPPRGRARAEAEPEAAEGH